MKVFMVGFGENSDFAYEAAFSTREKAEAYRHSRCNNGWYYHPTIDEWEVDAEELQDDKYEEPACPS